MPLLLNRTASLLIALCCCASAHAETAVLSATGYGAIRFGAPLADAEAALRQTALPKQREYACSFVTFRKYPGIRFMVEKDIVTRADAASSIRNSAGVKLGMPLERVKAAHPELQVKPHKYDDEGHYLILPAEDGSAALLFEESKGKVMTVRAGKEPSVEYVEECL